MSWLLCVPSSVPTAVPLQVAGLFHHASIGNPINIAIVRLILLEHEEVREAEPCQPGWAGLQNPPWAILSACGTIPGAQVCLLALAGRARGGVGRGAAEPGLGLVYGNSVAVWWHRALGHWVAVSRLPWWLWRT